MQLTSWPFLALSIFFKQGKLLLSADIEFSSIKYAEMSLVALVIMQGIFSAYYGEVAQEWHCRPGEEPDMQLLGSVEVD